MFSQFPPLERPPLLRLLTCVVLERKHVVTGSRCHSRGCSFEIIFHNSNFRAENQSNVSVSCAS